MRRTLLAGSLLFVLALACVPAEAGGNANFTLGIRQLQDDEFWLETDSQGMFGVTVDFGPADWPIAWAIGYTFSLAEEDVTVTAGQASADGTATAAVGELSFGVRKIWAGGATRPFIEAGVAGVIAGFDFDAPGVSADDSDTGGGLYAQAGVYWRIGSRFNLGLNARALFGTEIDLSDTLGSDFEDGDADYIAGGLILGWGWPAS